METDTYIVLASFNGSRFLAAQLDSLITQTHQQWTLLVLDDHSTDSTSELLQDYAQRDARIQVLDTLPGNRKRAAGIFAYLLETALARGAQQVFCCDQDDVWLPDKLEKMVAVFASHDPGQPLLLHHDLLVVDADLKPLAQSYWQLMKLQPANEDRPQRLLSRNEVTGCAMAVNRALLEIALPIPEQAVMHDWWLALCAAWFGKLEPLQSQWVKYRQHADNVIGARSFWTGLNPFQNWLTTWNKGNRELEASLQQAARFAALKAERSDQPQSADAKLATYLALPSMSRWQRCKALRQMDIWRRHWLLDLILTVRILAMPRTGAQ